MKHLSEIKKYSVALAVVVSLLTAMPAMAGSKTTVSRTILQGETHTGLCCTNWGDPISVVEPERPVPIVVTWSGDYRATAPLLVALRLNGGPCTFFGPAYLQPYAPEDETYTSKTMQWVIMPGDYKLVSGQNTIQLCGGGIFNETDTVTLGFSTFTARLDK